jgi:hypothetical protein
VPEELEAVVSSGGANRQAQSDESGDAGIAATCCEAHHGAEGKSRKQNRLLDAGSKPVERGADIVLLAAAVVVRAFAEAHAAEVEAQHRQARSVERLHHVIDNLVVHGSRHRQDADGRRARNTARRRGQY